MPITSSIIVRTPGAVAVDSVPQDIKDYVAEVFVELAKDVNRNGVPRWTNYVDYDASIEGNDYSVPQFIKYVKAAAMALPTPMVAAFRMSLEKGGEPVEGVCYFRMFPYENAEAREIRELQAKVRKQEREAAGKGTPGRKAAK